MRPVIAIDGPAGSGKSTLARSLGDVLGLDMLDTGAMYRAATLKVISVMGKESSIPDGESSYESWKLHVAEIVKECVIAVGSRVMLDGRDVTEDIRTDQVDRVVSFVASIPALREDLVSRQRQWIAAHDGGVVEGRDIGTVVCPDAGLKVYLTASIKSRTERRAVERDIGERVELESMIDKRDKLDMKRPMGALPSIELAALAESTKGDNMMVIDSTGYDAADVLNMVLTRLERIGIYSPSKGEAPR
jgi:cytidylate kinase